MLSYCKACEAEHEPDRHLVAAPAAMKQGWARDKYNAYMREYMKRWRSIHGKRAIARSRREVHA